MFELVMRAPQSLVEAASDALTDELEALSVSVEDADAGGQAEQALFGEPGLPAPRTAWERSTLSALFESESAATEAAAWLLAQPWAAGLGLQALREVPEQDWVRLTQAQFAPVAITPRFWVVPSWHEVPAEATRVLRLDPALPFGDERDLDLLPNTLPPQRHLGYAVQWFGLALTVLVVAVVLERRRRRVITR